MEQPKLNELHYHIAAEYIHKLMLDGLLTEAEYRIAEEKLASRYMPLMRLEYSSAL